MLLEPVTLHPKRTILVAYSLLTEKVKRWGKMWEVLTVYFMFVFNKYKLKPYKVIFKLVESKAIELKYTCKINFKLPPMCLVFANASQQYLPTIPKYQLSTD